MWVMERRLFVAAIQVLKLGQVRDLGNAVASSVV